MIKAYSIRINRKDLYSKMYDEVEHVNKENKKYVKINKSIVDVFIRMLGRC